MPLSALPLALLSKVESVYKTDSTPIGSANAILLKGEPTLSPLESAWDERDNAKAYYGHNQTLLASVHRKLSFQVEFGGVGSPLGVAAPYSHLIKACGHSQTLVATTSTAHAPATTGIDSVTQYFWIGDKKYVMVGARGNVKWMFTAGKIPYMQFDLTGLLPASNDVIDDTTYGGTLDLTKFQQPHVVNFANTSAFSLHGFGASELYSLEIDAGCQVVYRNKPNAEDVTIVDRKPTATIKIGEPTLALKNYYTNLKGAVLDVLNLTHGVGAGKLIGLASPKFQIDTVTLGKEDNVRTLDIKGRLMDNAGNDAYVWTLT